MRITKWKKSISKDKANEGKLYLRLSDTSHDDVIVEVVNWKGDPINNW